MSEASRIVTLVCQRPGLSACEISHALGRGREGTGSISSKLKKLAEKGELRREPGTGPRGGFTYHPKA